MDLYLEYFKFSPSIRGVFGLKDELIRDFSIKSERIHSINQLLKAYTLLGFN